MTVYGGRGDDKFFVGTYNGFYSLPADVTVYGGGGTDTMAVEDITPPFIPPDIPPPSDVYTITATTVSRSNAAKVTYSDLVGVSLNVDGSRGDTYNVVSTPYATPVTLTAGNGENIFNISPKDHSLDNIQGALTIVSVGGDDTLNVDDSANTIDRHVALNVTGDGPQRWGTISGRAVADIAYACNSTSSVYVMTGTAADTVNILATATPVYLNSRDGQDVVNVGNAGSVQGILGKLTIDNQRSKTTLNVDDSADTVGRTVTLTTSGGGHQPWGTISGLAPADIVYKVGRASVTLGGGTGDDTFAFSDRATLPGTIDGGEVQHPGLLRLHHRGDGQPGGRNRHRHGQYRQHSERHREPGRQHPGRRRQCQRAQRRGWPQPDHRRPGSRHVDRGPGRRPAHLRVHQLRP